MEYSLDLRGANKAIRTGSTAAGEANVQGHRIDFTNYYMRLDGKPCFVRCGEIQFSRYDSASRERELLKMKALGINVVSTYVFWIHHEAQEGVFDFSGDRNVGRFLGLCAENGLYVILRMGPYAHGECRNGGLPDWLFGMPFEVRSNDPGYLAYVERYFLQLGRHAAPYMFDRGGPVIALQLENEYMAACSPWEITVTQNREWITTGRDGVAHMEALRRLAENAGCKAAFLTCTGWGGSPRLPGMLPLWGGYAFWPWLSWDETMGEHPATDCYLFADAHQDRDIPFACCELGGGMQAWYRYRFVVPPESVEAMSLVKTANGCNFLGYYMFHGGRNPVDGRLFLNEQYTPRISYDFQAPLGDFGFLRESGKRLKLVHYLLEDFTELFCQSSTVLPADARTIEPTDRITLRYAARAYEKGAMLFLNNYQDHSEQERHTEVSFTLQTEKGPLRLPAQGGLTVESSVSCALPVQVELSGICLRYATAQYITSVRHDGKTVFFFFTHEGMRGEFCFPADYAIDDCENAVAAHAGKNAIVTVQGDLSFFTVHNDTGEAVQFCCMSRRVSLDFYKVRANGAEYAVIGKGVVYGDASGLQMEMESGEPEEVLAFPPLPAVSGEPGLTYAGRIGIFERYHLNIRVPELSVTVDRPCKNRAVVRFKDGIPTNLTELYVRVRYTGDIGWAFINGSLIHDDFNIGMPWTLGLKHMAEKLRQSDLALYISPIPKDGAQVHHESTYAKIEHASGDEASIDEISFHSVVTVPLIAQM